MNRRRLRQAKERLKTVVDSKRFKMDKWQQTPGGGAYIIDPENSQNLSDPECRTAGCFAGWLPTMFPRINIGKGNWSSLVINLFDLSLIQANYLFAPIRYKTSSGAFRKHIKISHVIEHIDNLLEGRL